MGNQIIALKKAWKSFSELWSRKKPIVCESRIGPTGIFCRQMSQYVKRNLAIISTKTGNRTKNRTQDQPKILWMNCHVKTNYIFCKKSIRSIKIGNLTENRILDQPEFFCGWIYISIQIHLHWILFDRTNHYISRYESYGSWWAF